MKEFEPQRYEQHSSFDQLGKVLDTLIQGVEQKTNNTMSKDSLIYQEIIRKNMLRKKSIYFESIKSRLEIGRNHKKPGKNDSYYVIDLQYQKSEIIYQEIANNIMLLEQFQLTDEFMDPGMSAEELSLYFYKAAEDNSEKTTQKQARIALLSELQTDDCPLTYLTHGVLTKGLPYKPFINGGIASLPTKIPDIYIDISLDNKAAQIKSQKIKIFTK